MPRSAANGTLNLGARIRQARLERGLSQGNLEQRTGLLRCYLSRVENGHTEPSLPTLARLASAMEMPLVAFFDESAGSAAGAPTASVGLTPEELEFLTQMRQFAVSLSEHHRQQVLQLAAKMAAENTAPPARAAIAGD